MTLAYWCNGDPIDVANVPTVINVRIVLPPIPTQYFQSYSDVNGGTFDAIYRIVRPEEFCYRYELESVREAVPPKTPQTSLALGDDARIRMPTAHDEILQRRKEWAEVLAAK